MTKMPSFDKDYIISQLDKLSTRINCPSQIFVIGGLALISYGLKEATKDVDVVVSSLEDLRTLIDSLKSIDYAELEGPSVYSPYKEMEISVVMENADGFRWDIFHKKICNRLLFSENMASRVVEFYSKGSLKLSLASKEDIFLFKGITEREADLDDMRLLAESGLDWLVVKNECIYQSNYSGRLWEDALVQKLIDLRERYGIRSPIEKELRIICVEKMGQNAVLGSILKGNITIKSISEDTKLSNSFVREIIGNINRKGLITINKTNRPYTFSLIPLAN